MFKTQYFQGCTNLQELKTRYKELVFKYHPDLAGEQSTEKMKQINLDYEQAFAYIKDNPQNEQEQKSYKYADVADGFREILAKLIHLEGISLEICGCWLWVGANTYPYKAYLKECGLYWAGAKKMWYWKPSDYNRPFFKKGQKGWDMNRIRDTYGSERIDPDPNKPKKLR
jgi:hypothetical protein